MSRVVDAFVRAIQAHDIEKRVKKLEACSVLAKASDELLL